MIMGSKKHSEEAAVRGHELSELPADKPFQVGEADSKPRMRKPRTPKDPATMGALELKIHKIKQSHKLLELAKGLDSSALAELIDELGKLQASAPAV
jgi:hypothetical protein